MSTRITDRAVKIADVVVPQNGYRAIVWADYATGARVKLTYGTRYWLRLIAPDGSQINTSTMVQATADAWLSDIARAEKREG